MIITDLDIIGFGDTLNEEFVPSIVPPVYQIRHSNLVIFPPFKLNGNQIGGSDGSLYDFWREVERGEATKIDTISAQQDHELWIDAKFEPHYEPRRDAVIKLKNLSLEYIITARQGLATGNFGLALMCAQRALCADELSKDALLIKAFICKQKGDLTQVLGYKRIALVTNPEMDFDLELENFK